MIVLYVKGKDTAMIVVTDCIWVKTTAGTDRERTMNVPLPEGCKVEVRSLFLETKHQSFARR